MATKKEEKKRTFESELALPPLKMVLAEAEGLVPSDCKPATPTKPGGPFREQVVLRLIEKLISKE
ncbi:MAG: hypothetical protein ACOYYJ_22220 [Chloroflexota bacterium]